MVHAPLTDRHVTKKLHTWFCKQWKRRFTARLLLVLCICVYVLLSFESQHQWLDQRSTKLMTIGRLWTRGINTIKGSHRSCANFIIWDLHAIQSVSQTGTFRTVVSNAVSLMRDASNRAPRKALWVPLMWASFALSRATSKTSSNVSSETLVRCY